MKNIYPASTSIFMLLTAPAQAQVWVNPDFTPHNLNHQSWQTTAPAPQYIPRAATATITPVPAPVISDNNEMTQNTGEDKDSIWSGRVNFGASLQSGNTEKNAILLDAEIKAEIDEKHRASLKAEYDREKDNGEITENKRSADAAYDYFFKPKWFINSNLGFDQDDIEQLDLRTTLGVGLGYQPYKSDDLNLQMVLGPTYLREDYENGSTDNSIAARWVLDYDQKVIDDKFEVFHNHEIFIPSDDTNAYLFESKTGLRVPIKNGLVGTGEIDFDWDNDPEPGVTEDDTKYSIKIGYEW